MRSISTWLLRRLLPVLLLAGGIGLTTSTPCAACTCSSVNYARIAKDAPLIVVGTYKVNWDREWHDEYGRLTVLKVEKGPKALRKKTGGLRTIHYLPRTPRPDDPDGMMCLHCGYYSPSENDEPRRYFMKPDPTWPGHYNLIEDQSLSDEELAALSR